MILKAFDLESINVDDLLETALDDPQAIGESKAFRGINVDDLQIAYQQFCKKRTVRKVFCAIVEECTELPRVGARPPGYRGMLYCGISRASIIRSRQ